MDDDDETVFERTVEWAIEQGIETATFHILTPYPGTALYQRMHAQQRMVSDDWDLFDTRHVVFKPAKMTAADLEAGYWRAYREFYKWSSIFRGASAVPGLKERMRHVAYAGGWKKFEPCGDWVIRAKRVTSLLPMLEAVADRVWFSSVRDPTGRSQAGRPRHPCARNVGCGKATARIARLQ